MMKHLILLVATLLSTGVCIAQTTAIPDANFEQALIDEGIDSDGLINGQVLTADIAGVTDLDLTALFVSDLTGINDFTALVNLTCLGNSLTSLAISGLTNLDSLHVGMGNSLSSISLTGLTSLTKLYADETAIMSLDLSGTPAIETVHAKECQLISFTVPASAKVVDLYDNNIISLNLASAAALELLDVSFNALSSLTVTNLTNLDSLQASGQTPGLNSISMTGLTALTGLDLAFNSLSSISFAGTPAVENLVLNNNALMSAVIPATAVFADLDANSLTSLDVSNATALTRLNCGNNPALTGLDASGATVLDALVAFSAGLSSITLPASVTYLDIQACQFASFDVSAFPNLTILRCSGNNLTVLDVSNNSNLVTLHCTNNGLTQILGLPLATSLITLYANDNQLEGLNCAGMPSLTRVRAQNNQMQYLNLSGVDITELVEWNSTSNPSLTCIEVDNPALLGSSAMFFNRDMQQTVSAACPCNATVGASSTGITCFGDGDGSATALGANGFAPYSYSWSNGGTTAAINSLGTGTYTVTTTDAAGCTATSSTSVSSPSVLSATATATDATCSSAGSVDASVSGGSPPYTYLWSTGALTSSATMLAAGTYTVTATDANGCFTSATATVGMAATGNTTIPDPVFEQHLIDEGYDTGVPDGSVPKANICGITTLDVSNALVSSLVGIRDFESLVNLYCQDNMLTSLDVSGMVNLKRLECFRNNIASLNLTGATALTLLSCSANQLATLDLAVVPALDTLSCNDNPLSTLDFSSNPAIVSVIAYDCELTTLVATGLPALNTLAITNNQLTTLNISNNTALEQFGGQENFLTELIATGIDFTAVSTFLADDNPALNCIEVDNVADANAVAALSLDPQTTFKTDCDCGSTQLIASDCGITLAHLNEYIVCQPVENAERYEFRFTDQATMAEFEWLSNPAQPTARFTSLAFFPHVSYGDSYTVEARARVNGTWCAYGPGCTVTAPAIIPTTQLSAAYCNMTLSNLNDYIYWDHVPGAERYQVEVTDGGSFTASAFSPSYAPTTSFVSVAAFDGIDYNTTYNVRVRVRIAGVWQAYGPVCTITSPAAAPAPVIDASVCGNTLASRNQYISFSGVPGATRYQHQVETAGGASVVGSSFSPFYAPRVKRFSMYFVNGLAPSTTYDVSVRAKVNGNWGNYGPVCDITMPASKRGWFGEELQERSPELLALPNPTNANSMIVLGSNYDNARATVRNLMGQVVQVRQVGTADRIQLNLEGAPGIYVVTVEADAVLLGQVKLVKQ